MRKIFSLLLILALVFVFSYPAKAGINDRFSDIALGEDNYILFPEIAAPSGSPVDGYGWLYVKDSGGTTVLYFEDDAGAVHTLSPSATAYDDIGDPDADTTIVFANDRWNLWTFADTNEDMFRIQGIGAFGDVSVVRIEQITGAATDGTVLEVVSADANVDPLVISALGVANAFVVGQAANVTIAGVATGTDSLTLTAGDITLTDGDLTLDTGEIIVTLKGITLSDATNGDMSIAGDLSVGGTTTLTGTFYLSDVVPAAGGLTLNAAGVSIIDIGNVSTGVINITGGGVNIGDGATDTLTITGVVDSNINLDDGVADSPALIFTDSDDETGRIHQDQATDDLEVTCHSAADSFAVTTGNLSVGTPASGVIGWDGGDFYVSDDAEIDGTLVLDGDLDANSTANISGALTLGSTVSVAGISSFSENIVLTAALDEYLQIDADTTPSQTTAGVLDIDVETATNNCKAVSIKVEIETGATLTYGVYVEVDDDVGGAEVFHAFTADETGGGTTATLTGLYVTNEFDECIELLVGAGHKGIIIDGTTDASTVTTGGLMDMAFRTATTTAQAINLDVQSEVTGGASEIVYGLFIQLDDDANTATDELHGIHITTDGNNIGLQHAIEVTGTGIDAALNAENGYLVVGTLASAGQTMADGTAYIGGLLEVDGNIYADGNITGDGGTEMVGVRHDVVDPGAVANYAVTAAMSGTVFINSQATEFDLPADPTGLEFTFIVHNATNLDIDPNVNDRFPSPITNANGDYLRSSTIGDSITIIGIDASTWYIKATYPAATDWVEE